MKTLNLRNHLKALTFGSFLLASISLSAQQTSGDITKEADVNPGTTTTGGAVRVIDNKGTIKYLQAKNGITLLSNTTNDVTTTTWQLGGTLTDDTAIDVNGNDLGLDGLTLITTETASTDAVTETNGGDVNAGTGYTLLVRDEATGTVKKLLASNLIQSGQELFTATADQTAYALTGSPSLPDYSKVWVYRNGAKLIANVDYTVAASTVTLVENDYSIYAGDSIEVQYVK
ncbi:hypothetical protein N9Y48_03640 [Zobellia sp.]|nr:hypothetical protein [Zobellia sp.]